MAESVTFDFEFSIGEQVYFRAASHNVSQTPKRFTVVEQRGVRCPGGTQAYYFLSCLTSSDREASVVNEVELTRDMPPFQPASEEWLAERQRIIASERAVSWSEIVRDGGGAS